VRATTHPELIQAMSAVSSIVCELVRRSKLTTVAYAGTPSFFNVIAEMKNPRDYTKSIILCQSFVTLVYLIIGSVVYKFCGQYVSSPALGSGGILMKKGEHLKEAADFSVLRYCPTWTFRRRHPQRAYACQVPYAAQSTALTSVLVRFLKGTRDLSENTIKHRVVWL
jgi:hypothetical protein